MAGLARGSVSYQRMQLCGYPSLPISVCPSQYIEHIGKATIVIGATILAFYEVIRNVSCKHLYNKKPAFKWWYFPAYAMLLIAATPFIILPALYVATRHVLNISSMHYYVSQKGANA